MRVPDLLARGCALLCLAVTLGTAVRRGKASAAEIEIPHPQRDAPSCKPPLDARRVVGCALFASPEIQSARKELAALAGQRIRAGTLLPSYPLLQVNVAGRIPPASAPAGGAESATALNWYLTLAQEIEIAGQRGARLVTVDTETIAQLRRVAVAEQEAAAAALFAYYDVLAAQEERTLATELSQLAASLEALAAARAREALAAPIDAEVAYAEATRLTALLYENERRLATTQAVLSRLLGTAGPIPLTGELWTDAEGVTPPETEETLIEQALALRGEIAAAEMEEQALRARVRLLRRERIPNLTLSIFAQRDGFDEQVFGGGLSVPLMLPAPLGPSRRGEIVEAQAHVEQAGLETERLRRKVRMEVERAVSSERSYSAELRLFPAERIRQAHASLRALAQALTARQLPIREALLAQRSLIELLQSHLRARLGYALARVERLRASGEPLLPPGGQS